MNQSQPHRATAQQWALIASDAGRLCDLHCLCLLELRARIEALEARRPTVQELCQRVEALEALAARAAPQIPDGRRVRPPD